MASGIKPLPEINSGSISLVGFEARDLRWREDSVMDLELIERDDQTRITRIVAG